MSQIVLIDIRIDAKRDKMYLAFDCVAQRVLRLPVTYLYTSHPSLILGH